MIPMPGESYRGALPPMTDAQRALREELKAHVTMLAGEIGPRNVSHPSRLHAARTYLETILLTMGYEVEQQVYDAHGVECANLIVERVGAAHADEIIIVGAHYDSCWVSPGADDNASAVAGVLALARRFADANPQRTVRFACFVNEEPPFFQGEGMGSLTYARRCRQRGENIAAMVCLEMIGCYHDEPGSQEYPLPGLGLFYPRRGDFIGFVGNLRSRGLVREVVGSFRRHARFPSEGAALPGWVPGISLSDHWSFWQNGYKAVMVTDTAMYRYQHYHATTDTPEKLDYERMARVVDGLAGVVRELANGGPQPRAH
ncbi:MAG: M20/M25/M40 family metallo-hydrolase [Planctomycetota bacterium]|nr:M20/M25/M40 family metallo-hydrolase [Planctomycetota bacterium]